MDVIELRGTLMWADYLRAQYLHMRPRRLFALIASVLLAVAFALVVHTFWAAKTPRLSAYLILLALVYFALFLGVFLPWRSRRIFNQQVGLHSPFEFVATAEGCAVKNAFSESRVPWSVFVKWKENRHLFLLYQSGVMFSIVPKRLFANENTTARFREWLNGNVRNAG